MQKIKNVVSPKSSSETYISLQYFPKYIHRTLNDFSNMYLIFLLKKKINMTKYMIFYCKSVLDMQNV